MDLVAGIMGHSRLHFVVRGNVGQGMTKKKMQVDFYRFPQNKYGVEITWWCSKRFCCHLLWENKNLV